MPHAFRVGTAISRSGCVAVTLLVGCATTPSPSLPGPMSGSSVTSSGASGGAASTGTASGADASASEAGANESDSEAGVIGAEPGLPDARTPEDGSPDVADAGDAGMLVAQCQALAAQFVTNCANQNVPDTARMCLWTAYSHLCIMGNTKLLVDSMTCFNGNQYCWTFSDCNTACTCLGSVSTAEEPAATKAFLQKQCTVCDGTDCAVITGQEEIIPYLSDETIATLDACLGNACSNVDAGAHCASAVPDLPDFAACNN